MREPYEPLLEGVKFLPFDALDKLEAIDRFTAGVIIEPIQAEGGVRVPSAGFMQALRRKCDETGAVLIFDEVQTGMGRTGRMWAGEHWGVVPDIMVLAKALGGGMPLAAFVGKRKIMETLAENPPFSHLTTFGGHPLSCAAGLAALKITREENLASNAAQLGEIFRNTLEGLKRMGLITEVRGLGLLLGAVLKDAKTAGAVVNSARELGLLVGTAMHDERVLRLVPPLNISNTDLITGLELLAKAIQKAEGK
jgi:acetylornithine/succinyldiaminopimelate/putrescine aminotransferase